MRIIVTSTAFLILFKFVLVIGMVGIPWIEETELGVVSFSLLDQVFKLYSIFGNITGGLVHNGLHFVKDKQAILNK